MKTTGSGSPTTKWTGEATDPPAPSFDSTKVQALSLVSDMMENIGADKLASGTLPNGTEILIAPNLRISGAVGLYGAPDEVETWHIYPDGSGFFASGGISWTVDGVATVEAAVVRGLLEAASIKVDNLAAGYLTADIGLFGRLWAGTTDQEAVQLDAEGVRLYNSVRAQTGWLKTDGSGWLGAPDEFAWDHTGVLIWHLTTGYLQSDVSPNPRIVIDHTEIAGYSDATTKQFYLSATDGKAYFAGGQGRIDTDGLTLYQIPGESGKRIRFDTLIAGTPYEIGKIWVNDSLVDDSLNIYARNAASYGPTSVNIHTYQAGDTAGNTVLELYNFADDPAGGSTDRATFTLSLATLHTSETVGILGEAGSMPTLDAALTLYANAECGMRLWHNGSDNIIGFGGLMSGPLVAGYSDGFQTETWRVDCATGDATFTGNLYLGLSTTSVFNGLIMEYDDTWAVMQMSAYGTVGDSNAYGTFICHAARGTFASPSAIQDGDYVGGFGLKGYDGTNRDQEAGGIYGEVVGNWTGSNHGMVLSFWATPSGSTTETRVAELNGAGDLALIGDLSAVGVSATGDSGGLAGATTLTDVADTAERSTGVGTIKFDDATARTNTGFIKIYVGTTAYYVPIFAAI